MGKVRVLDKHTAELIAAGEVVERPASVIKELIENSIDAGATAITVEIKSGGVVYMRITDDGEGIAFEDVPTAFLRHATSKIKESGDLDAIHTLGFRGEALASIAAVSKIELITRTQDEELGTHYAIEGGEQTDYDECGCAKGTTIIVRDIFYNTPARMKFLKKDVAEGNAVASLVDRMALSHPEVSFRLVRDGKQTLMTSGDGLLKSAIYAVFGKDFASELIPVDYRLNTVKVTGFITTPTASRPNRTMQIFYINGRYCRSRTMQTALEEGYKGSVMVGKHPACVLDVQVDCAAVDVNVHPAKLEVRFTNERPIFEGMYYAVKSALAANNDRKAIKLDGNLTSQKPNGFQNSLFEQPVQHQQLPLPFAPQTAAPPQMHQSSNRTYAAPFGAVTAQARKEREQTQNISVCEPEVSVDSKKGDYTYKCERAAESVEKKQAPTGGGVVQNTVKDIGFIDCDTTEHSESTSCADESCACENVNAVENVSKDAVCEPASDTIGAQITAAADTASEIACDEEHSDICDVSVSSGTLEHDEVGCSGIAAAVRTSATALPEGVSIIGEAFETYIIMQSGDELVLIDKHAAHERLIYERLRASGEGSAPQLLLVPISVTLDKEQYSELLENADMLLKAGFEIDDFGPGTVLVRSAPAVLCDSDIAAAVMEIAGNLNKGSKALFTEKMEDIFHTIACRSAIKAHDRSLSIELAALVVELLNNPDVRYCPHGRPIYTCLTRREIEKTFGRIQ